MVQYSEKKGKILRLAKSIYFDVVCLEGPIAFFNPVIPTQNFGQSRNPAGYFWHPTSRAYFQARVPSFK